MESSRRALLLVAVAATAIGLAGASFRDNCDIKWNPENAAFSDDGHGLTMSLKSNSSGCLLQTKKQFIYGSVSTLIKLVPGNSAGTVTTYYTKKQFIYGSVSTLIKLVPGNSAGTVTTYYTSSVGADHDEIDFEFLGNQTGQPYTLHTNVFADGVGKKEMQFVPWFDPTADFHAYTISWTPCMIVWYVDDVPIRVFRNYRDKGIAYPIKRPMFGYSSIWSAEDWATQGGRVKADWSKAPFVAGYRDMVLDQRAKMQEVQKTHRIYDYCVDYRDNKKPGSECSLPQY
uniref:Putative xyloglucan endotransglucosylase/hydrolase protein 26 n=1 Tax=Aegilops tauschii TaxID=37682 RepID=M8CNW5_AEGTA